MKFRAEINVMPQKALLDPQGKTVHKSMHLIGLNKINDVRIGKHIVLEMEAENETDARAQVEKACKDLLANQVMEHFDYQLQTI